MWSLEVGGTHGMPTLCWSIHHGSAPGTRMSWEIRANTQSTPTCHRGRTL